MPERWLGLAVSAGEIKVVDAEIPDDATAPVVIQHSAGNPRRAPEASPGSVHQRFRDAQGRGPQRRRFLRNL
jgi:hypothetical protein